MNPDNWVLTDSRGGTYELTPKEHQFYMKEMNQGARAIVIRGLMICPAFIVGGQQFKEMLQFKQILQVEEQEDQEKLPPPTEQDLEIMGKVDEMRKKLSEKNKL
jgi:hypothetical protein